MPLIEPETNASAAPPLSVFVDDSGAKRRRARRAGRLLGLGLIAYALVLLTGLVRPVPFPDADVPSPGEGNPPRGLPSAQEVLLGPAPGPVVRAAAASGAPVVVEATESTATTSPVVIEPAPLPTAPPTPTSAVVPSRVSSAGQHAGEASVRSSGPSRSGPR